VPVVRSFGHTRLWRLAASAGCVAVLVAFYVVTYGDATGTFFSFDDYWVLADAARIHLRNPLDVVQFFVPGHNGFHSVPAAVERRVLLRPARALRVRRGAVSGFANSLMFDTAAYRSRRLVRPWSSFSPARSPRAHRMPGTTPTWDWLRTRWPWTPVRNFP